VAANSTSEPERIVRFSTCGLTIDTARFELRDSRGQNLELSPLTFRLLVYLIEHRDRIVPKDELFRVLWGDVAVADGSLTQAIWTVRRVLRDDGATPRIVQNVRGRGYRFNAPVEPAPEPANTALPRPATTARSGEHLSESGRAAEIALLERATDDTLRGRGRAALISGGPGIGKTWLASQIAARAVAKGALACEGRGYEEQGAPPMWPLRQVALTLVRHDRAIAQELGAEHAGDLRMLAPELASFVPESPCPPVRTPSEQRFFVWSALVKLLDLASQRQPLVLVLEDLHWADDATLLFLERLATELHRLRLLLLCTYRDDSKPVLRRAITAFSRDSGTLLSSLSGLSEEAVRALLGTHGSPVLSDALLERALLVTSGNPLFVIQLARSLALDAAAAHSNPETLTLPAESRAVLRQQVDALPAQSRLCLRVAAALGDDFHLGELQAAMGIEGDALLELLAPADAARLLGRDLGSTFTCRFGHPSVRTVVYEDIDPVERGRIHRRIADALAHAAPDGSGTRLSAIAHHYYEAAAVGGAGNAARFGLLAADAAYRATAYEDTIANCRRVLGVLPMARSANPRARHDAELLLGHALRLIGAGVEQVRDAYAQAASAALEAKDPVLYARAAMSFAGRGPMGLLALRAAGTVEPREIALLERALELLPSDNDEARALAEGWLASSLYNAAQDDRKVELARRSVARARRTSDPATLVECLMLSQFVVHGPDALAERIGILREAAQLAARAGLREQQMEATEELAWNSFEAGDADGAEIQMLAVVRLAEEMGRPHDRRKEAHFRVMRLDAAGRYAQADALLAAVHAQPAWPPERVDQGAAIRGFMQQFQRGRCGEMIPPLEAMAKQFPLPVGWHCALVNAYATVGRLEDAQHELDRLAMGDFAAIPDDHNRISSYVLLAHSAYCLGNRSVASRLRTKLAPYIERNVLQGIHGCYAGPVSRVLGVLDIVLGDYEQGEAHLELALRRDGELGATVGVAWDRLLRAELYVARGRSGDRSRAIQQVQSAEELVRGLGLSLLLDWTTRLTRELATSSAPQLS
jgi:DNA-binding winged helix-turn-helix (wHTH) protein/tetratricopeptide (TPR) repeat protein